MIFYYVHDESSCAFWTTDPPEVVLGHDTVEQVSLDGYLRACEVYGCDPNDLSYLLR